MFSRYCRLVLLMLGLLLTVAQDRLLAAATGPSATAKRPVTVEDLLRQQDFGQAMVDPKGRLLVYEQTPPYDQLPDYSIHWSTRFPLPNFGLIMAVDLKEGLKAKSLFSPEPQTLYRLQSFSPDGQRLALYAVRDGRITLKIYDLQSGKLTTFKETPELQFYDNTVVWASSDTVVYAALPGDRQPLISIRRYTGTELYEAWTKTWKGKEPSFTEIESHADGGGKKPRGGLLVKGDVRSGSTQAIAEGRYNNLKVSYDNRFIAAFQESEAVQPVPEKLFSFALTAPNLKLTVVDLKTQKSAVVAPELQVSSNSLEWSTTSPTLAYFAQGKGGSGLYTYRAETGQIQSWPLKDLRLTGQEIGWLDEKLAVVAQRERPKSEGKGLGDQSGTAGEANSKVDWCLIDLSGVRRDLTSEFGTVSPVPVSVTSQGIYVLADGKVWRIGSDGTKTNLTPGITESLAHATEVKATQSFNSEDGVLLKSENDPQRYFLVDLMGEARAVTVQQPSKTASLMAWSVHQGMALFSEKSYEGTRLLLQQSKEASEPKSMPTAAAVAAETKEIGRLNQYLAAVAPPQWKMIKYRLKDGHELQSGMLLPFDYQPNRRYPVVVDIYPGRTPSPRLGVASSLSITNFDSHELLAGKGYIVFYVANPRDLERTKEGPVAGMADLVLQGVDALISQGYADPDRINLMGFSQGGFASLWMATETDRFRAILSTNGWSDLFSHYFEGGGLRRVFYPDNLPLGLIHYYEIVSESAVGIGRTPWQDFEYYIKNSPVYRAERIKTPLLMIHSDMDMFALNQYEEMFTALYRLRKEARFVRYWGEAHGPASAANIRDFWRRAFAWFDDHSDISRDSEGNLLWEGEKVKSRNGAAPLQPADFERLDHNLLKINEH